MPQEKPVCLVCERNSDEVPLIALRYREGEVWICPQHLPILIHKPGQLADIFPGLRPADPDREHSH